MNNHLITIVAFSISLFATWLLLPLLKRGKARQQILHYVAEHNAKNGTPTMGGIGFILAITLCGCVFCDLKIRGTVVILCVFVGYGIVGFLDDFIKIKFRRNMGLKAYQKLVVQLAIAILVALFIQNDIAVGSVLKVPFGHGSQIDLGGWIVPFVIFVYLACTNGVNLTDGIDGLATCTTICYLFGMVLLLGKELNYLSSIGDTYAYNQTQQVLKLCYISIGALFAFLLFNCNNAKVFMGDTGSLALGAMVACSAIFTRMTLFIPFIGIMFVVSCLSVIIQVVYFKLTNGKRVFLMSPYHHHLQKKGFSETRICVLYCAITLCIILLLVAFGE